MKKPLITLFAIVLTQAVALAGEPIAAVSRITDVTVYADRAQITRTADVSLPPGESRIVVAKLPDALQDQSVRASGKSKGEITIQDVQVQRDVRSEMIDAQAAELQTQLLRLHDQAAQLDARQRVVDQQRAMLQQIQIKAAGDLSRDIQWNKFDPAQLKELPGYFGGELTRLEEETQKIGIERRELEPKIRAAEAELSKRRAATSRAEKSVVVTVNANAATTFRLQVGYVIGDASWAPSYDARAAVEAGNVEYSYNAVVRQQTGEDWQGVNLTLSTARPAIGAQMPTLGRWALNFWEAVPAAPAMYNRAAKAVMETDSLVTSSEMEDKQLADAGMLQAQVEQGVTAVAFRVPRAADIPSDGEPHRQTVALATLPASFVYETTPKLTPFAYLKATATNSTEAPFLPGPVNIFVGPDFVGTSRISTVAPTETAELFLGIDEGIRVKREPLKDRQGKAGILRQRKSQVYAFKITVENFKDRLQRVVVFDQIPVSGNDAIKVELAEPTPKPSQFEEATGKLTWDLILKPREKREIVFEFSVEWPQDKQLQGL